MVTLSLWDTSGCDSFKKIRPLVYPVSDIFIVCYSTASRESMLNINSKQIPEIYAHDQESAIFLVGTQCDLRNENKDPTKEANFISKREGEQLAEDINALGFMEISRVKTNLDELFLQVCQIVLSRRKLLKEKELSEDKDSIEKS